jgi:hypothetical protein
MGLLGGLVKGAVAKKVIDEARKPHNQAKIRSAISSMTSKGKGGRRPR